MEIIKLNSVSKSFGKNEILKNINLNIKDKEKISIIGKNGSGKTTLINLIIGLIKPSNGEIVYPSYKNKTEFLNNLGIQFQDATYPKGYTVNEIINMVSDINFKGSPSEYIAYIKNVREPIKNELLKIFELSDFKNRKSQKLSGGQKQKLNVVLALVKKPKILILDEITNGLDIEAKNKIIKYIKDFVNKNKITLIMISHVISEINELTDRIILIDKKTIQKDLSKTEIIKKHKSIDNYVNNFFLGKKGKN